MKPRRRRAAATRPILLALAALVLATPAVAGTSAQRVAALHPIVQAAAHPTGTLVILYSGDGGWAAFDKGVAEHLNAGGASVVGVDALRYFLIGHSAQSDADDLAALIDAYAGRLHARHVVLAGFSFGADALTALVPRLPRATRARLDGLVLIAPQDRGELQFQPGDWIDRPAREAFPVAPLLASMRGLPMTCLAGAADRRNACDRFDPATIRTVRLPGDHHFNKDTAAVARAILAAGTRRGVGTS